MGTAEVQMVQETETMTAAEIRAEIAWVARNREHLSGHAGKLTRALDIARETVERQEAARFNMQPTIGPGPHGGGFPCKEH